MATPSLKLLQIDLTDECPLFCAHCSNSSGPTRATHFPIERLLDIIKEGRYLGLENVIYSGGEPLRYPYLEEALSAAKIAGISATIFTTGIRDKKTRLPISLEQWRTLLRAGLTTARFSVYAAQSRRQFHNDLVRSKPVTGDAFGANEQAIKEARSAGVEVEVHFIPCGITVADLAEIYSWAVHLGCSTLHLQIPTYQGRNRNKPFLELNSTDEARLKQAASTLKPLPGQTELYISRFWRYRWGLSAEYNCVASLEQLIVRTDGTISPCNACKYGSVTSELDNLLAIGSTLGNIWRHSLTLEEVRETRGKHQLPLRCEGVLATTRGMEVFQG